jgi:outer membrane protein OmpA-like peptidoglycan-associated protein
MHDTEITRLSEQARHVLTALRKKRGICGATRLAEQACGRSLSTKGDLAELHGYATAAIRLVASGHLAISREGDTVRFSLTPTGRSVAKGLSRSRRNPWRTVAGAGVWGSLALAVAGCSWLYTKPEVPEQYAPAPARPVQVAQYAETRKTVWRYCDVDCPRPTPKTIAIERPVMPVAAPVPPAPPTPPAPPPAPKKVSTYYAAFFPFAKASLGPRATATVKMMVPDARKAQTVIITGRTDEVGSVSANMKLADLRAKAVQAALVAAGVDPEKIEIRTEIKPSADLRGDLKASAIPEGPAARARRAEVQVEIVEPLKLDTALHTVHAPIKGR